MSYHQLRSLRSLAGGYDCVALRAGKRRHAALWCPSGAVGESHLTPLCVPLRALVGLRMVSHSVCCRLATMCRPAISGTSQRCIALREVVPFGSHGRGRACQLLFNV